jgi:hypothetical protein
MIEYLCGRLYRGADGETMHPGADESRLCVYYRTGAEQIAYLPKKARTNAGLRTFRI